MPDTTPVVWLIDRAEGSAGLTIHLKGAAPPVNVISVGAIELHLFPVMVDPIKASGSSTFKLKTPSIDNPSQEDSVATIVNVVFPVLVGVPLILPVVELRVSPSGKALPAFSANLYGVTPPLNVRTAL